MVVHKVHTPTNALFIKFDKVLKFTLKITSTYSKQQADVIFNVNFKTLSS